MPSSTGFLLALACVAVAVSCVSADTLVWTGSGLTDRWSDFRNWDKYRKPESYDNAIIKSGNATCIIDIDAQVNGLTVANGATVRQPGAFSIGVGGLAVFSNSTYVLDSGNAVLSVNNANFTNNATFIFRTGVVTTLLGLHVRPGAVLLMQNAGQKTFSSGDFIVEGPANISDGSVLNFVNGTSVNFVGGCTVSGAVSFHHDGSSAYPIITGDLRLAYGAALTVASDTSFGTINLANGAFLNIVNGRSVTGQLFSGSNSTVQVLGALPSLTVAGGLQVYGQFISYGTVNVSATVATIQNLTLQGAFPFTFTGNTLVVQYLYGLNGELVLPQSATLNISTILGSALTVRSSTFGQVFSNSISLIGPNSYFENVRVNSNAFSASGVVRLAKANFNVYNSNFTQAQLIDTLNQPNSSSVAAGAASFFLQSQLNGVNLGGWGYVTVAGGASVSVNSAGIQAHSITLKGGSLRAQGAYIQISNSTYGTSFMQIDSAQLACSVCPPVTTFGAVNVFALW